MYYITYTHPTHKAKTFQHKKWSKVNLTTAKKLRDAGYTFAETIYIPTEVLKILEKNA